MATNKAYISAGASPTKKSTDTPTNNSVYVSAGVSPVYVPSGPVGAWPINRIFNGPFAGPFAGAL